MPSRDEDSKLFSFNHSLTLCALDHMNAMSLAVQSPSLRRRALIKNSSSRFSRTNHISHPVDLQISGTAVWGVQGAEIDKSSSSGYQKASSDMNVCISLSAGSGETAPKLVAAPSRGGVPPPKEGTTSVAASGETYGEAREGAISTDAPVLRGCIADCALEIALRSKPSDIVSDVGDCSAEGTKEGTSELPVVVVLVVDGSAPHSPTGGEPAGEPQGEPSGEPSHGEAIMATLREKKQKDKEKTQKNTQWRDPRST